MAESESNPNPTATDHEEEKGDGGHMLFFNRSRHEHELRLSEDLPAYTCNGCKENGANIGYKCKDSHSSCKNFTLHEACANLPDVFQHGSRKLFKFRPKTHLRHHCDACRDVLKGFVFEAERPHHLRLHPLCMVLPEKLNYGGHEHPQLKLVPGDDEYCCSECRKNNTAGGWRYRCEEVTCQVSLDLSCAKINFYELSESGIARVAPMSRSRRFRSKLSSSGKWIASALFEGTISGVTEAVLSSIIS